MSGNVYLVTGGTRSGKSSFAQRLAEKWGTQVVYVATAEAGDPEMRERIAKHQASRPAAWTTVEAPLRLREAIAAHGATAEVILVDCLTMFISNLIFREIGIVAEHENPAIDPRVEAFIQDEISALLQMAATVPAKIIFVSNELGSGLVPSHNLGRLYRDMVGRANQQIAAAAVGVFWVTCGIAVDLKKLEYHPEPG